MHEAGHGFRPARAAFRRPAGLAHRVRPRGRSRAATLLALSLPSRGIQPSPARSRAPVSTPAGPCFLSWAPSTLRHDLGAPTCTAVAPATTHGHVRGLATSCAALVGAPAGARNAGASLGFTLQGLFPVAARAPLGVAALLALPAHAPHDEVHARDRPTSGPCSRHGSVLSPVLGGPAVVALLGFSPPEPRPPSGHSALVARPPFPPFSSC